jgi:hypothetical protein
MYFCRQNTCNQWCRKAADMGFVKTHLGGWGGKKAILLPSLWLEHPMVQNRQPTMLLVMQCVRGHPSPHISPSIPIFVG